MDYKNLNSLGRALRNGEVDRKSYILQRRNLIDAITSRQANQAEATANPLNETISELDTIISESETLVTRPNNDPVREDSSIVRILSIGGAVIVILAVAVFFALK